MSQHEKDFVVVLHATGSVGIVWEVALCQWACIYYWHLCQTKTQDETQFKTHCWDPVPGKGDKNPDLNYVDLLTNHFLRSYYRSLAIRDWPTVLVVHSLRTYRPNMWSISRLLELGWCPLWLTRSQVIKPNFFCHFSIKNQLQFCRILSQVVQFHKWTVTSWRREKITHLRWVLFCTHFHLWSIFDLTGYAKAANILWEMALKSRDYPIFGICLGFNLMATLSNSNG